LYDVTLTAVDSMSEQQGFSELSRAFKRNPTIENYVKLRRENPNEAIEIAVSSGLEWLFSNDKLLEAHGISPTLVGGILEADHACISELSLLLLEKIIEKKDLSAKGQTHLVGRGKAISESLIDHLICMILDSMEWTDDLRLDRDLIVLIRERLGGVTSKWEKEQDLLEKLQVAKGIALQIISNGGTPSIRSIAKAMNVHPSTVMRWFPDSDFLEKATELSKSILSANKVGKQSGKQE
jgi:hypothetical protein